MREKPTPEMVDKAVMSAIKAAHAGMCVRRAAPDLLAACKMALAELHEWLHWAGEETDDDPTVIALRAAIAKAEGK
jgi:hypothetical protein